MKLTITIDLDNAAFDTEDGGAYEAGRILAGVADTLNLGANFNEPYDRRLLLRDSAGNKVGQMEVSL